MKKEITTMPHDYYILWKYDADGVPDLVFVFTDSYTAKLVARIMSCQDEYKSNKFSVEEF